MTPQSVPPIYILHITIQLCQSYFSNVLLKYFLLYTKQEWKQYDVQGNKTVKEDLH